MLCDLYDETLQYQENLLGKYYVKHGHEVTVIAATFSDAFDYYADRYDRNAPAREYRDGKVNVIKLPYSLNFLNKLRKFRGVDRILAREEPDLIFIHDIHLNLSDAAQYKRRHPTCRIIMDYHADFSNSAKNWLSLNVLHKLIRKAILYRHRRLIDKFYPVVPASVDFLNEVYGIPRKDMELLPLGADTDLAKRTMLENAGTGIRSAYGIPGDAVVIFTGGKLTPAKKTHLLVDAFLALADPNLHLMVVGDSATEHANYKRQLIHQCAGHPRVHFVGWVGAEAVYKFMGACDFAVFPASQSVLWQQALSMGLPLIVGRVGVQDSSYMNVYGNMIILDEEDIRPDVLAANIHQFSTDRALLARLRVAALRATDDLLNYDKIVSKTLTFD